MRLLTNKQAELWRLPKKVLVRHATDLKLATFGTKHELAIRIAEALETNRGMVK